MTSTVDIDPELTKELRSFRLSKRSSKGAALIAKIDKGKLLLHKEEVLDPITPEELEEELPENTPRFVVLSCELRHDDGRVSYVRAPRLTMQPLVLLQYVRMDSPQLGPRNIEPGNVDALCLCPVLV